MITNEQRNKRPHPGPYKVLRLLFTEYLLTDLPVYLPTRRILNVGTYIT